MQKATPSFTIEGTPHISLELNGRQRHALRRLGHHLKPVVQIGQKGVTESVLKAIDRALLDHELIKVKVMESSGLAWRQVAEEVTRGTGSLLIQRLGRHLLIYRPHPEAPQIFGQEMNGEEA